MFRDIEDRVRRDLGSKMVLLSGPRQVGKSWLSKTMMKEFSSPLYLNWDSEQDRRLIEAQNWPTATDLLILDEIHKKTDWKSYLKGLWDTRPAHRRVLVTGSARLETFRQSGDSLAGRYFHHRLLPLTPHEARWAGEPRPLEHHLRRGGYPEPFLTASDDDAGRWRRQYTDSLIREDILTFDNITQLRAMNLLVELLRSRVASPVSYQSLSEDLGIAPNTVKHYIEILEALYIVFRVTPHHRSVARSLTLQPKLYFFDTGLVKDEGPALENLTALALYKQVCFAEDGDGIPRQLRYLRTKEGREVDFVVTKDDEPQLMFEVKTSETSLSPHLKYFADRHGWPGVQLVADLRLEYDSGTLQVRRLMDWLEAWA
jgi:predicted AAA+ superfamily ATPase